VFHIREGLLRRMCACLRAASASRRCRVVPTRQAGSLDELRQIYWQFIGWDKETASAAGDAASLDLPQLSNTAIRHEG